MTALMYSRVPCIEAHVRLHGCQIVQYFGLSDSTYTLQVIFCYFPKKMCTCQLFPFHHTQTQLFQLSQAQLPVFITNTSLETSDITTCSDELFSLFQCHLKTHFTLSFDAIKNVIGPCFFISQIGDDPMLYETITSCWLSPRLSLHTV